MSANDENRLDFSDPAILKACFEEQDEEIANAHGVAMNAIDECAALTTALLAILTALDGQLPGVRTIVADDLADAAARRRRLADMGGLEYDAETCAFLELESAVRRGHA